MTEKAEDLVLIEFHIDAIDGFKAILILLVEVLDLQNMALLLLLIHFSSQHLIAQRIHATCLKLHGFRNGVELTRLVTGTNLDLVA